MFLYSGCFGFNFILLHGAFSTVSWTYAEAVEVDGAGRLTVFFRIMLPICKGPIVAVAVLQAIGLWSDYSAPFLFMRSTLTLAVGLQALQDEITGNFPAMFSAIITAVLPMIILYGCFQKTIMKNTVAGGLKG
jgi:ABC-type glycerol-3-phosphate transport system permease component